MLRGPRQIFYVVLAAVACCLGNAQPGEIPGGPLGSGAPEAPPLLPDGALRQTGPAPGQTHLALSPDGETAATAGQEGAIRFYSIAAAKLVKTVLAHKGACNALAFHPSGKTIFSCGADSIVKEWDVVSGQELRQFSGQRAEIKSLACSPDGLFLAGGDAAATIHVWNLHSGKHLHAMTGHAYERVYSNEEMQPLSVDALSFSPNSRTLASEANDVTARLWDVVKGVQLAVLPKHDNSSATLAFSPDGAWGISSRGQQNCPYGAALRLWSASTGRVWRIFSGLSGDASCVAFSPDGRFILSGASDNTLRQWETDSGLELRRWNLANASPPNSVACGPDGKFAVTLSEREGVVVWKLSAPPLMATASGCTADEAWQKLASVDYLERAQAFSFYLRSPAPVAAAELARHLNEHGVEAAERLREQLAAQLDDNLPGQRVQAYEKLKEMGAAARPQLAAALGHPSLEVRTQAAALLKEIGGPLDTRLIAAIQILGALNTPEARAELAKIAAAGVQPYAALASFSASGKTSQSR